MADDISKSDSAECVVFANGDYVGLFRRFMILAIDAFVLALALMLIIAVWERVSDPNGQHEYALIWTCFFVIYLYLTKVKASRYGTLGFMLMRVRIVDFQGKTPSMLRMTFRILLWFFGPINPIIDLFWLGGDRHRQTLRDKFAGTYVVNRDAKPVGRGKRKATYYNFVGATFVFWEIEPLDTQIAAREV